MGKHVRCWNCRGRTSREGVISGSDSIQRIETTLNFVKVFEGYHHQLTEEETTLVELCEECRQALSKLEKSYSKFMKLTKKNSKIHVKFRTSTFWSFPEYVEDGVASKDVEVPRPCVNNAKSRTVEKKRKAGDTSWEGLQKKIKIKIEKSPEPKTATSNLEDSHDVHSVRIKEEPEITKSRATVSKPKQTTGGIVIPADQPHILNTSEPNLLERTHTDSPVNRNEKETNLIVLGVFETLDETNDELKDEVEKLFRTLNIGDIDYRFVRRVGISQNWSRAILVELVNELDLERILRAKHLLCHSRDFKDVYINRHQTGLERFREKVLREKAKIWKASNPMMKYYICDGRLIVTNNHVTKEYRVNANAEVELIK